MQNNQGLLEKEVSIFDDSTFELLDTSDITTTSLNTSMISASLDTSMISASLNISMISASLDISIDPSTDINASHNEQHNEERSSGRYQTAGIIDGIWVVLEK